MGNYLYAQDKEKASEFLKSMEARLSREQAAAEVERIQRDATAEERDLGFGDKFNESKLGTKLRELDAKISNTAGDAFAKGIVAGQSGLDSSMQGLAQAMTDEVLPRSQLSYTGEAVRETTSGLGRLAYDSVELVSHMLPSILTSYAIGGAGGAIATTAKGIKTVRNMGQIASSLVTAVSAAGNSYAEQMEKGLTKKQSKTIAALTGASEGGLQ